MDELARRAGVTKPVIYELFGSKEGLFRACLEGLALRLAERDRGGGARGRCGRRGAGSGGAASGRRACLPSLRLGEPLRLRASLRGPLLRCRRERAPPAGRPDPRADEGAGAGGRGPARARGGGERRQLGVRGRGPLDVGPPGDGRRAAWRTGPSSCSCQDYGGSRDAAPSGRDRRHRLLGPRNGDQAEAGGRGGLRAARARRRHRRHLARQHLSRAAAATCRRTSTRSRSRRTRTGRARSRRSPRSSTT